MGRSQATPSLGGTISTSSRRILKISLDLSHPDQANNSTDCAEAISYCKCNEELDAKIFCGSVDSNEYGGLLKLEKDGTQYRHVPIYLQTSIERKSYPSERVWVLRGHTGVIVLLTILGKKYGRQSTGDGLNRALYPSIFPGWGSPMTTSRWTGSSVLHVSELEGWKHQEQDKRGVVDPSEYKQRKIVGDKEIFYTGQCTACIIQGTWCQCMGRINANTPWSSHYFCTHNLYPILHLQHLNVDVTLRHIIITSAQDMLHYFFSMNSYRRIADTHCSRYRDGCIRKADKNDKVDHYSVSSYGFIFLRYVGGRGG